MIERIFPGMGGILKATCTDCVCCCSVQDPKATDTSEDEVGEQKEPSPLPW